MGHFSITITGKPNVGKSTLYNKLLQKKHAIACNTEGVTRDYNEDEIKMADGTKIILRDTAGIIISPKTKLEHLINDQTKTAINNARCQFGLRMPDAPPGVYMRKSTYCWTRAVVCGSPELGAIP